MLIRERVPFRSVALYCCALLYLLTMIVRYTWVLWDLRTMEWQFLSFVLAFAPMLVLALAAFTISIPPGSTRNAAEHYFAQARPFYILLAVFFMLWTLGSLVTLEYPMLLSDPLRGVLFRTVIAAIALVLAYTKKEALHWLGLTVFFASAIVASLVAVPQL